MRGRQKRRKKQGNSKRKKGEDGKEKGRQKWKRGEREKEKRKEGEKKVWRREEEEGRNETLEKGRQNRERCKGYKEYKEEKRGEKTWRHQVGREEEEEEGRKDTWVNISHPLISSQTRQDDVCGSLSSRSKNRDASHCDADSRRVNTWRLEYDNWLCQKKP